MYVSLFYILHVCIHKTLPAVSMFRWCLCVYFIFHSSPPGSSHYFCRVMFIWFIAVNRCRPRCNCRPCRSVHRRRTDSARTNRLNRFRRPHSCHHRCCFRCRRRHCCPSIRPLAACACAWCVGSGTKLLPVIVGNEWEL